MLRDILRVLGTIILSTFLLLALVVTIAALHLIWTY